MTTRKVVGEIRYDYQGGWLVRSGMTTRMVVGEIRYDHQEGGW
jgi:hypothetical protein